MSVNRYQINIKLDLSVESAKYYKLLDRWENEGGSITEQPKIKALPEGKQPS